MKLGHFHKLYKPLTTFDIIRPLGINVDFKPPLNIFPWDEREREESRELWGKSRFCGPSSPKLIREIFLNMVYLNEKLESEKYQPGIRGGLIRGTFLKRNNGYKIFIVIDGNHRLAVLSHLGYSSIHVGYLPGRFHVINESEVENWLYVRKGFCTANDALSYFNAFFELSGIEQAKYYGIL